MGFQGQLSSVNLTDIFQTLHMNRQSGTLSVTGPESVLHIYFENGSIALVSAPPVDGMPFLVAALLRKGLLDEAAAGQVAAQINSHHQQPRQTLLANHLVAEPELDEVCAWCGEELVCPIFDWREGEFVLTDGAPARELSGSDMVEMGRGGLQTTSLLLEASRRNDEWRRIREVITDLNALYIVDQEGRANLANLQTDPDMLKVLRFLDGRNSLEEVSKGAGISRFDTFAITAQLVLAGVARQRTAEEVLHDALTLRQQGDAHTARDLLELIHHTNNVPEVLRPLAEVSIELKQAPRAVELYLELIQISQDQGDLEQALADIDTVLSLSPDDPDLQVDRAKVLGELGKAEESAAAFTAAAQALLNTRDIPRAIDACHRAKNLLPRSPDPHRWLAKAYILDGNTENALVEYKALWHALLSVARPRKALESFKEILDSDCRFNGVKEQALSHAQNSEAVKTGKAVRWLVYVACFFLVVAGGVVGVQFYFVHVVMTKAMQDIADFRATMPVRINAGEHLRLQTEVGEKRSLYATIEEARAQLDLIEKDIAKDFESRAEQALLAANALLEGGQFDKADAAYKTVATTFKGTRSAGVAKAQIERVRQGAVAAQVQVVIEDAELQWRNLDWDAALARIRTIAERKDLPADLSARVQAIHGDWRMRIESSQALYERAEALEKAGRKKEAIEAYQRAATAKGDAHVQLARNRLAQLEVSLARELGDQMRQAFDRGDDRSAFQYLDELGSLAKSASGKGVSEYVTRIGLPFTLKMDGHQTSLIVKRGNVAPQTIRAPSGKSGPWSHPLFYAPGETLTVEARRTGFAPQTLVISALAKRSSAEILLKRGPLWQSEIDGMPVTTPIAAGKFLMVGTDRSTLEVIDPGLGNHRPVTFPQTVDEFRSQPVIYQNLAWTVLDHRAWAIDLATRTPVWTWPPMANESPRRLTGWFRIQDHELIPGQSLLFLAGAKGQLHLLAIDKGRGIPYPSVDLGNDLTGAPVGEQVEPNHTLLFIPTGNQVQVFDTATVTEHQAPTRLYATRTRGDIIGTMVPATVAERKALLAIDSSGLLIALALAGADLPDEQRAIGSWSLDGTGVDRAVVAGQRAYVSLAEGRVVAVSLARPGQVLWTFPAQKAIGNLAGAPAIGRGGIYVADTTGALYCLDPETGAERWRTDLGSQVRTGILTFENRIYVPTRNGTVVCFEEGEE